jgi:hypothetical protein
MIQLIANTTSMSHQNRDQFGRYWREGSVDRSGRPSTRHGGFGGGSPRSRDRTESGSRPGRSPLFDGGASGIPKVFPPATTINLPT